MADDNLVQLTADIVSAHVGNNTVPTAELPTLIQGIYDALAAATQPAAPEQPKLEPVVPIRFSVKHDHLVCLEDGKKLKMLKRYLRTNYNMTPEDYRAKWGLPRDYPMVAPAYAEQRASLAKAIGLGRKGAVKTPASKTAAKAPKTARKTLGIAAAKAAAAAHLSGESTKS